MFGLAIHGGAGTLPRAEMSSDREQLYRAALTEALTAGYTVLESGGTSLDAVTRAVAALEDDPLFNAGRGAVFTIDGRNELDASIMDGTTLGAGAVSGVTHIKNPIELARTVMEHSDYVLLAGSGAEEFALTRGYRLVPRSYFHTAERFRQLERSPERSRCERWQHALCLRPRAPSLRSESRHFSMPTCISLVVTVPFVFRRRISQPP